jgi:hypothetical protein
MLALKPPFAHVAPDLNERGWDQGFEGADDDRWVTLAIRSPHARANAREEFFFLEGLHHVIVDTTIPLGKYDKREHRQMGSRKHQKGRSGLRRMSRHGTQLPEGGAKRLHDRHRRRRHRSPCAFSAS